MTINIDNDNTLIAVRGIATLKVSSVKKQILANIEKAIEYIKNDEYNSAEILIFTNGAIRRYLQTLDSYIQDKERKR